MRVCGTFMGVEFAGVLSNGSSVVLIWIFELFHANFSIDGIRFCIERLGSYAHLWKHCQRIAVFFKRCRLSVLLYCRCQIALDLPHPTLVFLAKAYFDKPRSFPSGLIKIKQDFFPYFIRVTSNRTSNTGRVTDTQFAFCQFQKQGTALDEYFAVQ